MDVAPFAGSIVAPVRPLPPSNHEARAVPSNPGGSFCLGLGTPMTDARQAILEFETALMRLLDDLRADVEGTERSDRRTMRESFHDFHWLLAHELRALKMAVPPS